MLPYTTFDYNSYEMKPILTGGEVFDLIFFN